jgi:DNA-binding response OmpR family regulator
MPKEILIVDDEPGVVVALQFLMEQQGYNVLVAQRIMLPGIDGYEVCEIVRLNPDYRDIKILFLTARRDEVEIAKGLALGADAFITKPFSNDKLIAAVNEVLERTYEEAKK